MKKKLNLKYKGSRNYLHGSDFFNELSTHATELTGVVGSCIKKISFRQFANAVCEVTDLEPIDKNLIIGQVEFLLEKEEKTKEFWIVKTDENINSRYPYDENLVLTGATVDLQDRSAVMIGMKDYTFIEYSIALTKHLNYAICPEVSGKWVFGQLDMEMPVQLKYQKLEVRMKNLIPGRFSVNEISIDGARVGIIRFIVGNAL